MLRHRRRPRFWPQRCAVAAALLLLLSVFLLYSRLASDSGRRKHHLTPQTDTVAAGALDDPFDDDPLLRDSDSGLYQKSSSAEDRIDEFDVVENDVQKVSNEEEMLRGEESEEEEDSHELSKGSFSSSNSNGYYFDHVAGAIRRAFDKRSIDEIDGWDDYSNPFDAGLVSDEERSKGAFGSDEVPLDQEVRRKMVGVKGVEDVLLLQTGSRLSPLRDGWGSWFDAKSQFLRRDKMFRSSLEVMNPLNHPLLQDPDGSGVTVLSKEDKIVLKGLSFEFKKVPFLGKKTLRFSRSRSMEDAADDNHTKRQNLANDAALGKFSVMDGKSALEDYVGSKTELKGVERKISKGISNGHSLNEKSSDKHEERYIRKDGEIVESSHGNPGQVRTLKYIDDNARSKYKLSGPMIADGKRWGYFPGLYPHLSFSNFMDAFFRNGKCSMKVFMVWNSPPWMFGTRHQRSLESLLLHHPDACVVVFSEKFDLDFFKEFVKDGFKVAVAMPNLEELLKDTPTSIFASVWHEWRSTKYYSAHYSELVRLAALYKYGGIYLDFDVIVLRRLSSFSNTIGLEVTLTKSRLNGAVMVFKQHSRFIVECLKEFYASYDDTLLRWNGADLLARVAGKFSNKEGSSYKELEVQRCSIFFPISSHEIIRFFNAPETESEMAQEDVLYQQILNESHTFHFWDSITSALIPEPGSLVARVIDYRCIRCSDVL